VWIGFGLHVSAISLLLFSKNAEIYFVVFFLIGAAMDGLRLAFSNMILILASQHKRPVYIALQSNLTSIGLFFPILGALIVDHFGYEILYCVTIFCLGIGFFFSLKMERS
jgi:MFS family permease